MEWVAVALGLAVVVVLGFMLVLRRRAPRSVSSPPPMHMGSRTSKGVEDSMSTRLPTGGNI